MITQLETGQDYTFCPYCNGTGIIKPPEQHSFICYACGGSKIRVFTYARDRLVAALLKSGAKQGEVPVDYKNSTEETK